MLVDDHEIILVRGLFYRAGMCENIGRRVSSQELRRIPMAGVVESGSCTPPALELRVTFAWPELIVED